MKKTYITPSILTMDLNKEMPVLCVSGGVENTNNSLPENDNNSNLFSVGGEGWREDMWSSDNEEE